MSYANNKGAEQPAHLRSLISAFVVRCLDKAISLVSVTKISSLMLASVAEQAGLSLTWSETPEDTFSHDEAQLHRKHLTKVHELEPDTCTMEMDESKWNQIPWKWMKVNGKTLCLLICFFFLKPMHWNPEPVCCNHDNGGF